MQGYHNSHNYTLPTMFFLAPDFQFIIIKKRFIDSLPILPNACLHRLNLTLTLKWWLIFHSHGRLSRCFAWLSVNTRGKRILSWANTSASFYCITYIFKSYLSPLSQICNRFNRWIIYEVRQHVSGNVLQKIKRREGPGGRKLRCCCCMSGESFDTSDDVTVRLFISVSPELYCLLVNLVLLH